MRSPINSKKRNRLGTATASPRTIRAPSPRRPANPVKQSTPEHTAMTIGKLAKRVDVSTDTLRFYEEERLLLPGDKSAAGYRLYGEDAVRRLDFIKQGQQCGMTLAEIKRLLELKANDSSCCSDVRGLAIQKKLQIEQKIKTMQAMSQALSALIEICTAGAQPLDDCPILAALESSMTKPPRQP